MSERTPLSFDDFYGELRELIGRVVAVQVRDASGDVVATAEGELSHLASGGPVSVTCQLGGLPPLDKPGLRFFASSFVVIDIPHLVRASRFGPDEGYIGARTIHAYAANDVRFDIWPAMPPDQQYTEMHDVNR